MLKKTKGKKMLKKQGIGMFEMLKNPYILMMVSFVMMAMLAQFFAHYSFLVGVKGKIS